MRVGAPIFLSRCFGDLDREKFHTLTFLGIMYCIIYALPHLSFLITELTLSLPNACDFLLGVMSVL